jgi:hypothetical protein
MRNDFEDKLGSTIVARINQVRMSELERQRALDAMHDADLIVDAFFWVAKKIEQFGERLFLRPALKH